MKIIFELTNLCNFKCTHCIRNRAEIQYNLPVAIVEKTLRESQTYHNINTIAFTGGEPTLHPYFQDIVKLVVKYGHQFGFVTNGWNFQEKTLGEIKPFRDHISRIHFSLDGAKEETHDTMRHQPGSFRRVIQAITLCRFHEIPVIINTVVTRANRTELEDIALLASRLRCEALGFAHCQPTPDGLAAGLVLDTKERRQVESDVANLQEVFKFKVSLAGDHYSKSLFFQCTQLQMQEFNIDYRGNLTFCCMLSGYRGGIPDTDVLADLSKVSFHEAHRRLVARIAEINLEKIDRVATQNFEESDYFICNHCLSHFQKIPQVE